jgi:hypothetical protein
VQDEVQDDEVHAQTARADKVQMPCKMSCKMKCKMMKCTNSSCESTVGCMVGTGPGTGRKMSMRVQKKYKYASAEEL